MMNNDEIKRQMVEHICRDMDQDIIDWMTKKRESMLEPLEEGDWVMCFPNQCRGVVQGTFDTKQVGGLMYLVKVETTKRDIAFRRGQLFYLGKNEQEAFAAML